MKTKKYLHVVVNRNDGTYFKNPLKLSEAYLISKMAQENKEIIVSLKTIPERDYKIIFG